MRVHRSPRNESGAAMVEFAVVLPLFLFVMMTMISVGVMFSFRQTLSQAATEGARAAAVAPSNLGYDDRRDRAIDAIEQAFQGELGDAVTCGVGGLTCDIPSTPTTCGDANQCISVTLSYAYADNPRVPVPQFFGGNLGMPENLEYTASARIE